MVAREAPSGARSHRGLRAARVLPKAVSAATTAAREVSAGERPSEAWRRRALVAIVVLAGAWAYATSFSGAFVFDDFAAIVENQHIRTPWPLSRAMSSPPDITLSGRPVASLTFALNYALAPVDARETFQPPEPGAPEARSRFLRNVRGYHAVNLAIHLAAALALFGVVRRTLTSPRLRAQCGGPATTLAFAVALIWVVHPLNTSAVTYLVQRVESLMGLCVLVALYCAIRAAEGPRALPWSGASVAATAIGLGVKEVAAVVPLLVLLWDRLFLVQEPDARVPVGGGEPTPHAPPRGREEGDASRGGRRGGMRWGLYAALASTWVILAFTVPGARPQSVGFDLRGWTPWTYLLTQSGVLLHYLRLAAWPSPLVLDPHWPMATSLAAVAAPFAVVSLLLAVTCLGVWRRHPLSYPGAWFFVILAPTSSVLPIVSEVAAEHRTYLPLAGIVAAIVVLIHRGSRRLAPHTRWWMSAARMAAGTGLLAVAVVSLGVATRERNLDYASDEAIWRDAVREQPENPRVRMALGANLLGAGRYPEAEAVLREALALDPNSPETLSNLGGAEFARGKVDDAIEHLERALALRPEYVDAHRNLAEAYVAKGRHREAIPHFLHVLAERPDHVTVLNHCALILAVSSDDRARSGARALPLAERAVRLTARRDAVSLSILAAALAELDRFGEAVAALREALAVAGDRRSLSAELEGRLRAYESGRKVRMGASSRLPPA